LYVKPIDKKIFKWLVEPTK